MKDYIPLKKRNPEQVYLEYVNNFITIQNMAQWYGVNELWLTRQIELGRLINSSRSTILNN